MVDTVLSIATRAVLESCQRLGLEAESLMTQAGLTPEEVFNPDSRLPAARADALWQKAYEAAGDPHLALHAAESLPFGAYKVIDFLAAHSPTIGAAFQRIAEYFPLVDPRASFVVNDGEPTTLTMTPRDDGVQLPAPAQEYTFAALVSRARVCVGRDWAPDAIELAFSQPADASEHRRIFAAEVRFGCSRPRIVCSRNAWNAPIRGADPALLPILDDHARRLMEELPPSDDLVSRVRSAIADELNGGEPTPTRVARRLAMSTRTLQRRLQGEGQSLAQLVDDTRAAVAKAHLADPAMSLAEIAWLVGFSDQSAFTRAFRRWTGQTPRVWRTSPWPHS